MYIKNCECRAEAEEEEGEDETTGREERAVRQAAAGTASVRSAIRVHQLRRRTDVRFEKEKAATEEERWNRTFGGM